MSQYNKETVTVKYILLDFGLYHRNIQEGRHELNFKEIFGEK